MHTDEWADEWAGIDEWHQREHFEPSSHLGGLADPSSHWKAPTTSTSTSSSYRPGSNWSGGRNNVPICNECKGGLTLSEHKAGWGICDECSNNDQRGSGGGAGNDRHCPQDEPPPDKKPTSSSEKGLKFESTQTCRRCKTPLTYNESWARSGNCNACHHPTDQKGKQKGSAKGKDDTPPKGKGEPPPHRTDNHSHQSWH